MEINSTLLIQAINFLIAYTVLRHFLFKPLMQAMMQETNDFKSLISMVEARKIIVVQKEAEKRDRWAQYQRSFKEHIPSIHCSHVSFFNRTSITPLSLTLSVQTVSTTVENVVPVLVKKVENAL